MFSGQDTGFSQFQFTLSGGSPSRSGDSLSTVNSFWSGLTSTAQGLFTNTGIQTYTGYYAATLTQAATCTATLGGAAGWMNCRGRAIRATFSFSAGDRIVFFAGKTTAKAVSAGQKVGAGGGASCLMTHSGSTFTPLIVAAGGTGCFEAVEAVQEARPLSESNTGTLRQSIRTTRANNVTSGGNNFIDGCGGCGRSLRDSAQQGGAGFYTGSFCASQSQGGKNVVPDPNGAQALNAGAMGGPNVNSGASAGGFGGGGGDYDGNCYGCGGGGYFGGWETEQSCSTTPRNDNTFPWYFNGTGSNNEMGPMSFVASSGTSISDLGHNGTNQGYSSDGGQTRGYVTLDFSP